MSPPAASRLARRSASKSGRATHPLPESTLFGRGPILLSVYDLCLGIAIVCVPLMMVGIRELGVGLFVLCSLTMGATWAVQQLWRPFSTASASGAEAVVLLAIGLVLLQLAPISSSLLSVLSPFSSEFLTVWHGQLVSTAPWRHISLTPGLTRSGLVLLFAYSVFFLTLVHRLRTPADVDRTLKVVAVAAVVMAIVGLGQLFFGNGKYLWLFDHHSRDATGAAKGSFANQNHFAGFLALGIGPLILWWQSGAAETPWPAGQRGDRFRGERLSQSPALHHGVAAALAAVLLAAVLSFSRGGLAATVVAFGFTVLATAQHARHVWRMALPVAAFTLAGIVAFGSGPLADAWDSFVSASSFREISTGRVALWEALLTAVPHFWPAGSGLGSHAEVYPIWLALQSKFRFSHAECGYLQVLLEMGVPGMLLLLAGLSLCANWCRQTWTRGEAADKRRIVAVAAGLLAGTLHSLVDFVWYVPGYMIVTLVLAACACRCAQMTRPRHAPPIAIPTRRLKTAKRKSGTSRMSGTVPMGGRVRSSADGPAFADPGLPVRQTRPQKTGQTRPRRNGTSPASNRSALILAWTLMLAVVPVGGFSADTLGRTVAAASHWSSYRTRTVRAAKRTHHGSIKSLDESLNELISDLEGCVRGNPQDHRAACNLAALYLRRFEVNLQSAANRMTLRQVQDTVRNAEFANQQQTRDWLFRAFGQHAADLYRAQGAARYGLQGQPLRGETYIVLAEVGFLEALDGEARTTLVEQAVRLRPHTPPVLYAAGSLFADAGDWDAAFEYWRRAFAHDSDGQPQLVRRLAPYFSGTELIDRLNPAAEGLWLLFQEYGKLGQADDRLAAAQHFQQNLKRFVSESDLADATFWERSFQMLAALGERTTATHCLHEAVRAAPDHRALRRRLAAVLIEQRQFNAAIKELEWCQLREPENQEIAAALKDARAQRAVQRAASAGERPVF